ncbi:MAG: RNA polymerase sigma factor [Acidimicrobiia bacterium]
MTDQELYRKHADELVRYATGLVGPFDAPDVVADAWLRATHSKAWSGVTHRRAYLYRSVLNEARSHHRRTLRRRVRELKVASPLRVAPPDVDVDVLAAVDKLSINQRSAIVLTYWEDLRPEDVAGRMGISAGSVKKHLARARSRLKELLDDRQ